MYEASNTSETLNVQNPDEGCSDLTERKKQGMQSSGEGSRKVLLLQGTAVGFFLTSFI